jgi:hypothetical protein
MNNMLPNTREIAGVLNRHGVVAFILLIGTIGTFLRLYLLGDQILLNDEWHGLFYAAEHPVKYLLGHPVFGANSAPLNVYYRLLLDTAGWSENWIRLPSLLPGILALFLFPFIVKKAHGQTVAVIFSIFLALSPFLTFYSRVARPYSMLVFLLFISIYSAGFWLFSKNKKYLFVYISSAVLAVYFQPVAMVTVFVPLVAGGICSVFSTRLSRHFAVPKILPSWLDIVLAGSFVLVATCMIFQPSLITGVMRAHSAPTAETWKQSALLLFGTSSFAVAGGLLLFCAVGILTLFRRNLLWGIVFLLLFASHIFISVVGNLDCIFSAIVLARYAIILFPISFICAAFGLNACFSPLDALIKRKSPALGKVATGSISLFLLALLLITNPLRDTYASPNNFTNHSAFQESYDSFHRGGGTQPYRSSTAPEWAASRPASMPVFYRTLPASTQCLIEYPLIMEDHFDPYYYYQQYHKKRVIAGYAPYVAAAQSQYTGYDVNVLPISCPPEQARFKNLVNILDAEAVRKNPANYIILHRNLVAEFLPGKISADKTKIEGIEWCAGKLQKNYGPPVYTDESIIVFDVSELRGTGSK